MSRWTSSFVAASSWACNICDTLVENDICEESIDELNKSGRFKLIDKDRDADFRTDEEQALIDIVIKVNNKSGELELRESSLTGHRRP